MDDLSKLPLKQSSVSPSRIIEGEWISLYDSVASRPAYFRMTATRQGKANEETMTVLTRCAARMFRYKICHVPDFITNNNPAVLRGVMLENGLGRD